MDRLQRLRTHISKEAQGIEIGPFHSPVVPKCEGFNSVSLDVYSKEQLIGLAEKELTIPHEYICRIEEVDLVGAAQDIELLVQQKYGDRNFDYIVSSHNLEHLPDPIRFLQGCRRVLKPGGYLSMAVPDHRCCFDYFRPLTTLADWLEAYFEERTRPTSKQLFASKFMFAENRTATGTTYSFDPYTNPYEIFAVEGAVDKSFACWRAMKDVSSREYKDAHCWTFTPTSFRLICLDLQKLSFLPLTLDFSEGPYGNEFFVHFRANDPTVEDYETRRLDLMRLVIQENRQPQLAGVQRA